MNKKAVLMYFVLFISFILYSRENKTNVIQLNLGTNNMNHFLKSVLIFCYAIFALACSQSKESTGKATLTGKFSGSFPVGQIYTIKVEVPNLVLGEFNQFNKYETQLELDGSFSFSIPLFSSVYAMLSINEGECGAFFLSPDKETKIELLLNETGKMQVKIIEGQELTIDDIHQINESFMEFFYKVYRGSSLNGLRLDMSPKEYKDYLLNWTEEQITIIIDEPQKLPEDKKQLLSKIMKWHTHIGILFDYESQMRYIYEQQQLKKEANNAIFTPIKPDKEYYSFLRFFDLNNPPELGSPAYSTIYQYILDNDVLNIPCIVNVPLEDWLKEVKTIMTNLVGSDTGLFYDFLITHAYMQQLEEVKPLSDRQKEDIKKHFKNPTFVKLLFVENDATIKQSQLSSIIKETPIVEKEKLIETIVSQHKEQVVIIDFWATWCGPCLQAIKEMKPLKEKLQSKNIAFVYVTGPSSPIELWKKKIIGIDGEHYYLTEGEWTSISSSTQYGFDGIPTYLIFDKDGILKQKVVGYPGIAEIQKIIEELL